MEGNNGNTPNALPGNAPIRTAGDHVGDTILSPSRHPLNLVDGFQRLIP